MDNMSKKSFAAAMVSAGILVNISCFAEDGKGPVCYLPFAAGKGEILKDFSGNGNDGKILKSGKNTKWVKGKIGKALEFIAGDKKKRNNNGCVSIPSMNKYDFSKGLTVEAWIKFSNKRKRTDTCEIISNTIGDRGKGFRFTFSWNSLRLKSGEGGSGKTWCASSNFAKKPISNNVWYHVAGTYNGSVFKVYINGEEVGASKPGLALTKGRKNIYIGAYCGGVAYGFKGVIDEIKIYDYPRSALKILKTAELGAM
jgi:Concanavalin A-like lectin/glucanases superfamily